MDKLGLLFWIVIVFVVAVIVSLILGNSITGHVADAKQAQAAVAHEQAMSYVETARAYQQGSTERLQTVAVTVTALASMVAGQNAFGGLLNTVLVVIAGGMLLYSLRR